MPALLLLARSTPIVKSHMILFSRSSETSSQV